MRLALFTLAAVLLAGLAVPDTAHCKKRVKRDRVRYEKYYRDPVLKEMKKEMDSLRSVCDSVTSGIVDEWRAEKEKEREERKVIRFDFAGLEKPGSPDEFEAPFHFPPVPQYMTGTCWSFGTTSFFECEVKRLTGKEIKLSEMHSVYWEYVEKARSYVRKRGNQAFVQGSESDAVAIIWEKYGVVPLSAYTGLTGGTERHNHSGMAGEMKDYLEFVKEHGYWNEESVAAHIRQILDLYLGPPPASFRYEGREMTPLQFRDEILGLNLDDYVQLMSTLSLPFYTRGEFDVPDNWRPTATYYNVPVEEFYRVITEATKRGYTVCIGGDVSEPGYYGFEDAAIVPSFDIPSAYIDQDSREFRFFNRTTSDDHCVHLLSYRKKGDDDWFLIKDSARSSRHGRHHGYYFYRGDYIILKMLTCMLHKDAFARLMPMFERSPGKD